MFSRSISSVLAAAIGLTIAVPQQPVATTPKSDTGELNMQTTVGSFKMVSPGERKAYGKLEMTFRGTVLIVDLEPNTPIQVTGNVRKEYENDKRGRILYSGAGRLVIDGKFRAIQWFGRDLTYHFVGMSIFRVYGEFDKNGKVGTYTIKGDQTRFWHPGGMTFTVPMRNMQETQQPIKVKIGN